MYKLLSILLLTASMTAFASPESENQAETQKHQSLFDKIFNPQALDDGCYDFPQCDIDVMAQEILLLERARDQDLNNQLNDEGNTSK